MRDYWSFEAVMRSFKANPYGKFQDIDGLCWRVRGGDYLLVDPPPGPFTRPEGSKRIRSLAFLEGTIGEGVPVKKAGWVYGTDEAWTKNRKTRYAMRLAERDKAELFVPTKDEIRECFETWVRELTETQPTKMLVKGHYLQMIEDPGFEFIACRVGNEILGASGVTWEDDDGAVCFTKHRRGVWWLSRYLWVHSLDYLFSVGVKEINCGDTADHLKQELGFNKYRQYKVDFDALHLPERE